MESRRNAKKNRIAAGFDSDSDVRIGELRVDIQRLFCELAALPRELQRRIILLSIMAA